MVRDRLLHSDKPKHLRPPDAVVLQRPVRPRKRQKQALGCPVCRTISLLSSGCKWRSVSRRLGRTCRILTCAAQTEQFRGDTLKSTTAGHKGRLPSGEQGVVAFKGGCSSPWRPRLYHTVHSTRSGSSLRPLCHPCLTSTGSPRIWVIRAGFWPLRQSLPPEEAHRRQVWSM